MTIDTEAQFWLALVIGNTRLHWGLFCQEALKSVWHTPHLTACAVEHLVANKFRTEAWQALTLPTQTPDFDRAAPLGVPLASLWIASVVPVQTALWSSLDGSAATIVERSHLPLSGLYPTLGIDRAVNLLGAGHTVGWPVLVIDGGTALTFTAGIQQANRGRVYGGAILPGIRLQKESLARQTATLAQFIAIDDASLPKELPARWATDTPGAIASGLIYGTISAIIDYLNDWWQRFPTGKAVLIGGDGPMIHELLQQRTPAIAARVQVNSHLMFQGMQVYRKGRMLDA
ncbi:MAG: pantothenate kinase [Phormidesmis sp.]